MNSKQNDEKQNGTDENCVEKNGTDKNCVEQNGNTNKNDSIINLINEFSSGWVKPSIERAKTVNSFLKNLVDTVYDKRSVMEKLVDELNPDVICFDTIIMIPFLMKRPFVQIMTMVPLFMDHPELPPYSSGILIEL